MELSKNNNMANLILIRHGKSEWNKLGLWTGLTDVDLAEEGVEEAKKAGEALRDIEIHNAHVSALKRAKQTLAGVLGALNYHDLGIKSHKDLNERDYGIYTGKNKWEIKEQVGEEEFQKMRRGWDVPIPEGETLKDVSARVIPYFSENILPELKNGKNSLVVAHGNTLRSLIKHLDGLDEEGIAGVEVGTGEVHVYKLDDSGAVLSKEIRSLNTEKGKV